MTSVMLSDSELALIRATLERFSDVTGAILFGSRAKGTAKPTSDIDLALEGVTDGLRAEAIASELEELPMIAKFDVQALAVITHAPLLEHIERVGVRIYVRAGQPG
jgi:predicted nucleotidyltransferase